MAATLNVLLVEDSDDDALLVVRELRRAGHEVRHTRVETREDFEAALRDETWDLVITDNSMPRFSADEAIRLVGAAGIDLPVLVVSGTMTEEHAVAAMRAGARDFIVKGNLIRLLPAVERELREAEGRRARLEAELALRRSSKRQSLILGHLPMVLYSANPGATLWVSDNSEEVTGFPPMAFLGRAFLWKERIHPEDRERVLSNLTGIAERKSVSCEYRWQKADGQWRWFLDHATLIEGDGGVPGAYHGMLLDVSERRNLEDEFRQAQKMEALGQLAAGVAHDFNNMLTVVQGYGELLQAALPEDGRPSGFAREILKAVERAAALTRQLLAFSRRQLLQLKVLQLNDVVDSSTGMLQRLVTKGVRLVTVLDPRLRTVLVDPGSVDQILMNLAVNARDAMNGTGELRIETSNVGPDDSRRPARVPPGEWAMISVTDTGCGMDEALVARIFEPFFTTKEAGHGTGLGLATVKGIVERSGGHIVVDSSPGKGTTFRVLLPPTREVAGPTTAPSAGVRLEGKERILVVDDDEAVARVTTGMLEAFGYSVLSASSGEEALEVLRDGKQVVHLVVTEVVMPGMDGFEFVAGVQGVRPGMPTMYVSGHPMGPGSTPRTIPPDAVFLSKPFSGETLAAKVREALADRGLGGAAD